MIRAVLFDLDDTLFDHRHASRTSLAALHAGHAHLSRYPLEEVDREYRRLLEETHGDLLRGGWTQAEARAERWRRLLLWCGQEMTAAEVVALSDRYRAIYQDARRPAPGALALLQALRPFVRIGIVTNNLTTKQREKLVSCQLDGWIDLLVTSEEVGIPKPDPAIYEAALTRLGCTAHEAVMVGDSWEADVRGAHDAGLRAVWYNPEGLPCPDPTFKEELRSFEPVEPALERILGFEPNRL